MLKSFIVQVKQDFQKKYAFSYTICNNFLTLQLNNCTIHNEFFLAVGIVLLFLYHMG